MAGRATSKAAGALGLLAGAGLALSAATRRARRIDLRGRVVLITGGARGLGFAIARAFLQRGSRLAICGRDGDKVAQAVEALRREGGDVFGAACDTSNPEQVRGFVDQVLARFGTIDVLVNNAGQCFVGPAAQLEAETVEKALRGIFWLQFHPTMAVLPHMRTRRFGRIVNITSISGKLPVAHQAAYTLGKYAVTGWSETLAIELARDGVHVSTLTPPPLRNGAPMHVHFNGAREGEFIWFTRILTSRLATTTADRVARVVVDAAEHGDRERTITPLSWLGARVQGLAPNLMTWFMTQVERFQPPPGAPGERSPMRPGHEVVNGSQDPRVHALAATARADEEQYLPGQA
ncbi:SDR family oxidoreductase [Pyxidicoccus fallax]|uniref:SDR family oxidoreductase n=1 Tax=Pyxidicoccus fallax TaxID=394095 RepID=A0A848LFW2_9BACT|nr:SDR family oxidoreductase [Pyxidicoccus fallax]NMO14548.1 SDR family oxidoreductase [Pyxidicoccus fallax]NPC77067.1 SDR family oxidoreductase [Pyxidicoccus fallax]